MFDDADIVLEAAFRLEVLGTFERPGRGKDTDHAGFRAQGGGFHGRFHPHEGNIRIFFAESGDGGRRGGVAGDDDDVRPLAQEEVRDGAGAVLDERGRLVSVRAMGVVRVIDIAFVGEQFHDLPVHRQAA